MNDLKFKPVPDSFREYRRSTIIKTPIVTELLEGKTLFVAAPANQLSKYYDIARRLGYVLSLRKAEYDGEQGNFMWLTKREKAVK